MKHFTILLVVTLILSSCTFGDEQVREKENQRIISLNATMTEMMFALGLDTMLVGRDLTSVYPPKARQIQDVGSSHSISLESLLALRPTEVICESNKFSPDLINGLTDAGVTVVQMETPKSISGAKALLAELGKRYNKVTEATALMEKYNCVNGDVQFKGKNALFIYSRGGGNLLIAGGDTGVSNTIELAGGVNLASEVQGFKPLTSEALVAMNPEVIVMFDHGFESSENGALIWSYPGMSQTIAARDSSLIHFPSYQLNSFGLNICEDLETISIQLGSKR